MRVVIARVVIVRVVIVRVVLETKGRATAAEALNSALLRALSQGSKFHTLICMCTHTHKQ